jgi:hypothetical protein
MAQLIIGAKALLDRHFTKHGIVTCFVSHDWYTPCLDEASKTFILSA